MSTIEQTTISAGFRSVPCERCEHPRLVPVRSRTRLPRLCPLCIDEVAAEEKAAARAQARRDQKMRARAEASAARAKAAAVKAPPAPPTPAVAPPRPPLPAPDPTGPLADSITAKGLVPRLLPDGRIFVNSARGRAVIETSQDLRWLIADLNADARARSAVGAPTTPEGPLA
jgi:hypothetical protein